MSGENGPNASEFHLKTTYLSGPAFNTRAAKALRRSRLISENRLSISDADIDAENDVLLAKIKARKRAQRQTATSFRAPVIIVGPVVQERSSDDVWADIKSARTQRYLARLARSDKAEAVQAKVVLESPSSDSALSRLEARAKQKANQ